MMYVTHRDFRGRCRYDTCTIYLFKLRILAFRVFSHTVTAWGGLQANSFGSLGYIRRPPGRIKGGGGGQQPPGHKKFKLFVGCPNSAR